MELRSTYAYQSSSGAGRSQGRNFAPIATSSGDISAILSSGTTDASSRVRARDSRFGAQMFHWVWRERLLPDLTNLLSVIILTGYEEPTSVPFCPFVDHIPTWCVLRFAASACSIYGSVYQWHLHLGVLVDPRPGDWREIPCRFRIPCFVLVPLSQENPSGWEQFAAICPSTRVYEQISSWKALASTLKG